MLKLQLVNVCGIGTVESLDLSDSRRQMCVGLVLCGDPGMYGGCPYLYREPLGRPWLGEAQLRLRPTGFARSTGDFMLCLFSGGRGVAWRGAGGEGGHRAVWVGFGFGGRIQGRGVTGSRVVSARRADAEGDSLWCGPLEWTAAAAGNQSASPTLAPSCSRSCSCSESKTLRILAIVSLTLPPSKRNSGTRAVVVK